MGNTPLPLTLLQMEVAAAYFYDGRTQAQIAEDRQISQPRVHKILRRVREVCRQHLGQEPQAANEHATTRHVFQLSVVMQGLNRHR